MLAAIGMCVLVLAGCAERILRHDTLSFHNTVQNTSISNCELQTQFRLGIPIPSTVKDYNKFDSIEGLEGRYALQEASTTRSFTDIQIHHKAYVHAVEDKILSLAKDLNCNAEAKFYAIDVTIIVLNASDSFPGDVSKPYGFLDVSRDRQEIKGQLYFNPIQMLADQLWLDEGKVVPSNKLLFTVEEFSNWMTEYASYRYRKTEELEAKMKEIPDHVMWLFSKSPRRTSNIFALDEWHRIVLHSQAGYILLTQEIMKTELCKECFQGDNSLMVLGTPELFQIYRFNQ